MECVAENGWGVGDRSRRFVAGEGAALVGNLAALWGTDAGLAIRVEEELLRGEGYGVEAAQAGGVTVAREVAGGRKIYLHSRYQPAEEARRLIESAGVGEKTVVVVHGLGLGYHVEALFDRVGNETQVVVFEPDVRMVRTALEHRDLSKWIKSGRLWVFTEADRSALMLRLHEQQAMVCVGLGAVEHGPSVQLEPGFYREAKELVEQFAAYCKTTIQTVVLNGRRTAENIARNLDWYVATPGINALKDARKGRPAVIVSAGPSLRKNKHLIGEAAERGATVIAVQTTLQPLLEIGVEPDFVTSLDYHDICTRFFEKLPAGLRTHLVAEPKASGAVLKLYPGPISVLGNEYADGLLGEMAGRLGKDRLRAGATVAHLAFYLAEYLGCDPIVFVGQDLGFADGLAYAPGTSYEDVWRPELSRFCTVEMRQWEHIARERPILRRIEDQEGRGMYTEERLFAYLQQFERDFATSRATIVDATEGGARKRGAVGMTFREAIERYCGRVEGEVVRAGGEGHGYRWELLAECVEQLEKRRREAEEIRRIGGETSALLGEIKEKLADQGVVNRLIARVDALRAEIREFNACYELVTQLCQQTEFERFKNDRLLAASKAEGVERQRRQLERDVANVKGIVEAAGEFVKLVDRVIGQVRGRMEEQGMAGREQPEDRGSAGASPSHEPRDSHRPHGVEERAA